MHIMTMVQARKAAQEIMDRTEWSVGRAANFVGLSEYGYRKIVTGVTNNVTLTTMKKLERAVKKLDKMLEK